MFFVLFVAINKTREWERTSAKEINLTCISRRRCISRDAFDMKMRFSFFVFVVVVVGNNFCFIGVWQYKQHQNSITKSALHARSLGNITFSSSRQKIKIFCLNLLCVCACLIFIKKKIYRAIIVVVLKWRFVQKSILKKIKLMEYYLLTNNQQQQQQQK